MEDEAQWLQHRLRRMRTLMRFARDPKVVTGLMELIVEDERRLEAILEEKAKETHDGDRLSS
jgi:hypothetical protein